MRTPPLILVVDDNAMNVDILQTRLRAHGYETVTAANGHDAIAAASQYRPDLILLDVMMPGIDGFEVCRRLKSDAAMPFTPIVMVTAKADSQDVVAGLDAGADEYLTKPLDQAALVARVRSMLRIKAMRDTIDDQQEQLRAQADQLTEWNHTLEARIEEQVSELERVARLKAFFSPQIAELVVSPGNAALLESHRREITVVSCDLGGFATFGELAEPEEMIEVLREFHESMGELIGAHRGTLEHFVREGIVVLFNDPVPVVDHGAEALRMTSEMRDRVRTLARTWKKRGHDLAFRAGIALGYATLGKVGFEGRFHYGAIGSVMNTASALLDAAEAWQILITPRVVAAAEHVVHAEPVGAVDCRGLLKPVAAFEVVRLLEQQDAVPEPVTVTGGRVESDSAANRVRPHGPSADDAAVRWRRLHDLFDAALAVPRGERDAFVRRATGDDPKLSEELRRLLASHEEADSFLETPAAATVVDAVEQHSPPHAVASGVELGPYTIDGLIGVGAMGEVYRAHDARLGRPVAIKILPAEVAADADRVRRFEEEARSAGSLNHPNIMAIHFLGTIPVEAEAFGPRRGSPYIVAELLNGETLRARMATAPPSTRKALDWAAQIARGLAAAHARGIVHRDLKPENLFVTMDGLVKILDFGLAKLVTPEARRLGTLPGSVFGTPGYMAPEQIQGRPADHRADIFALGAVLYELMTGCRAFRGETMAEALNATLNPDAALSDSSVRKLSRPQSRIIGRCLQLNPDDRFQSASDLAFAVEALQ